MNKYANNKESMRNDNRKLVLWLLHNTPLSRADLSKQTGLTQAAISSIMDELIGSGLIFEGEKIAQPQTGRRPTLLEINPDWAYIIGISIDHDGFELGVLNVKGQLVGEPVSLPYSDDVSGALAMIAEQALRLMRSDPKISGRLLGAGVIAPGPIDDINGVILNAPAFDKWHHLGLREEFEKRLGCRTFVQHNANAFARAEYSFGLGKQYNSFAEIIINAGIGMGMVLNGSVYSGINGLGHTSIDINGRVCACGNRGCLEMYASTSAVLYDVRRVRRDIDTWQAFMDACAQGDAYCLQNLENQADHLAHAIINLNNLLELNTVFLNGLILYRGDMLAQRIQRRVSRVTLNDSIPALTIQLSGLRENASIVAAGAVVTDRLFRHNLYVDFVKEHSRYTLFPK